MSFKRIYLPVLFLLMVVAKGSGNDSCFFKNFAIETQLHYGFIIPHHSSIEYFLEEHIQGIEINLYKKTTGRDIWQQLYRKPIIGAGYFYSSLGNDDVYGHAHAIYGFMDIPLFSDTRWFNMHYKIGFGLGYLTEKFSFDENYFNQAIGSHLNVCIRLVADMRFAVSKRFGIVSSLGLTHFSNGKIETPNYGLNLVAASIGINYLISEDNRIIPHHDIPKWDKRFEYVTFLNAGLKSDCSFVNGKYFISTFVFDAGCRFSYKYKTGLGIDFIYDGSARYDFEQEGDTTFNTMDMTRYGIHWFYDINYSKLSMTVQVGYTIYSGYELDSQLYNRLGLRYKIAKHLLANISLVSHMAVADFVEWGIGYTW